MALKLIFPSPCHFPTTHSLFGATNANDIRKGLFSLSPSSTLGILERGFLIDFLKKKGPNEISIPPLIYAAKRILLAGPIQLCSFIIVCHIKVSCGQLTLPVTFSWMPTSSISVMPTNQQNVVRTPQFASNQKSCRREKETFLLP